MIEMSNIKNWIYAFNRYGIRVDPISWVNVVYGQYHKEGEFPVFWMLGCKSKVQNWKSKYGCKHQIIVKPYCMSFIFIVSFPIASVEGVLVEYENVSESGSLIVPNENSNKTLKKQTRGHNFFKRWVLSKTKKLIRW